MKCQRWMNVSVGLLLLAVMTAGAMGQGRFESSAIDAPEAVRARYEDRWAEREAEARTIEARETLASEMLSAAEESDDRAMGVLLCKKAYELASVDLRGYVTAANALDQLQRLAPEERTWALEKLVYLYETAFKRNRMKLALGVGQAETLEELAIQRVETATAAFEAGEAEAMATFQAVRRASVEAREASKVLSGVVTRVERRARRIDRREPAKAETYRKYVAGLKPDMARIQERVASIQKEMRTWASLLAAERRFEAVANARTARALGEVYVVDLNQPEAIPEAVMAELPDDFRRSVKRAAQPVDALDGAEALALAKFYKSLGEAAASEPARKQAMLIRARLYHRRAEKTGAIQPGHTLADLDRLLIATGISEGDIDSRTTALDRRLDYQFKEEESDTDGGVDDGAGATSDVEDESEEERTSRSQEDRAADDEPKRTAADVKPAPSRKSRPMTTCTTCGRRFFPGWTADPEADHECARCAEGGKSIFDIDRE